MKKAQAVVGSGWGDEGKGLLVDHLASKAENPVVIRYSGGANAGHTVKLPGGSRHVFSHFGAGTFCNAPTYLSEYFIVNPLLYRKEHIKLKELGLSPIVTIDPSSLMTTPYDMMINQCIEERRGDARHGSCGAGINETMKRSEHDEWKMTSSLMAFPNLVRGRLRDIRQNWMPMRMEQLGIEFTDHEREVIYSDSIIDQYIDAIAGMVESSEYRLADASVIRKSDDVIFEGSQGLLLDAKNEMFFPHVTNARTGVHNIRQIMKDLNFRELEITYATRAYATRHGAGPFPQHDPAMSFPDPTNQTNEFQGSMRFGLLDFDLIEAAIFTDLQDADLKSTSWKIGMSCMDQVANMAPSFRLMGEVETQDSWEAVAYVLSSRVGGLSKFTTSYGPTRANVDSFD